MFSAVVSRVLKNIDHPLEVDRIPRIAIRSLKGNRDENQDSTAVLRPSDQDLVCMVADGLGGYRGGLVASRIAVGTISEQCMQDGFARSKLVGYVDKANEAICEVQSKADIFENMRTTLILLHIDEYTAYWMHCGDSRLYHVRDGNFLHTTRDHSMSQVLSDPLNDARNHPDRNKLTRSLGGAKRESRVRVIADPVQLKPDDCFLLCTDGWWESLSNEQILEALVIDPDQWLGNMQSIIEDASDTDKDNYSAVAVSIN